LPDLSAERWTGWWYKAYLFSQESGLRGPVLYLDLDTVICSSIDFLADTVLNSIQRLCISVTSISPKKEYASVVLDLPSTVLETSIEDQKDSLSRSSADDSDIFFACLKTSEITNEGN
jgi:hypothetical protein